MDLVQHLMHCDWRNDRLAQLAWWLKTTVASLLKNKNLVVFILKFRPGPEPKPKHYMLTVVHSSNFAGTLLVSIVLLPVWQRDPCPNCTHLRANLPDNSGPKQQRGSAFQQTLCERSLTTIQQSYCLNKMMMLKLLAVYHFLERLIVVLYVYFGN